jgi:hypothetical protein
VCASVTEKTLCCLLGWQCWEAFQPVWLWTGCIWKCLSWRLWSPLWSFIFLLPTSISQRWVLCLHPACRVLLCGFYSLSSSLSISVPLHCVSFYFLYGSRIPCCYFPAFLATLFQQWFDGDFISSYLLCFALRAAFGVRHLPWRWKKMSRLLNKYITFGLFRDVNFAKHHRSPQPPMATLPEMHALFQSNWRTQTLRLSPPDKTVVFVPQVVTMWECRGVRKYQHPKCSSHLLSMSCEGAINHSPSSHPSPVFLTEKPFLELLRNICGWWLTFGIVHVVWLMGK